MGGFLKKVIICIVIFAVFCQGASCEDIIQSDFYLYDRKCAVLLEECKILPNTLRINLNVGENYELFAEAEGREDDLRWESGRGIIEIYPERERCIVYGISPGEDKIKISIDEDDAVYVDVMVENPREIIQRTFENKASGKKKPVFSEKLMRFIINALKAFSGIAIFTAFVLLIKKKRRR